MVSYMHLDEVASVALIVLILVVVEDGLVLMHEQGNNSNAIGLNPCCSGRWSRTIQNKFYVEPFKIVLILVVVEDGLVR